MATDSLRLTDVIPAPPERVYAAWLSSKEHEAFTGDAATIEPVAFGRYSTFGGYAEGLTLELDQNRRIVQTFRTTDFPKNCPDSRLEVLLEPEGSGTRITLLNTDLPEGDGERYADGWRQYYLAPLKTYFGGAAKTKKPAKKKAAKKKATGKKAASKKPTKKSKVASKKKLTKKKSGAKVHKKKR